MNCPACGTKFTQKKIGDVELNICDKGCGGIWFDQFEFKKFDEPHEPDVAALFQVNVNPNIHVDHSKQFKCPKCPNIIMMRRFSSPKRQIQVDECAQCAGIWLDIGELNQIRQEYHSESERKAAAEKMIEEMFGTQMASEKKKNQDWVEKTQNVANALKYICPSYYIPGKQRGGAF